MNVKGYGAAYDKVKELYRRYNLPNPYADEAHRQIAELRKRMRERALPEHAIGGGEVSYMTDQVICRCGWESNKYWDGWDFAIGEWYDHVYEAAGLKPQECICGEKYVTAYGGKPCHEMVEA